MQLERDKQNELAATAQRFTYTVDEVASLLGICRNMAYEAVKRNEIPSVKIGRRLLVPRAALDLLLAGVPQ